MLNFRKLKHDFVPAVLKDGKSLHDKRAIASAKITSLSTQHARVYSQVAGSFDNVHSCAVEFDLSDSTISDSDCDCLDNFDCQHVAALLFYLESHYDELVVEYSRGVDLEEDSVVKDEEKESLLETIKEAVSKEEVRRDQQFQKELLKEYTQAAQILGRSPFFVPEDKLERDHVDLTIIFALSEESSSAHGVELQLALKLPYRSKLLLVPNLAVFLESIRYGDPVYIGPRRYYFPLSGFDGVNLLLAQYLLNFSQQPDCKVDKNPRIGIMSFEHFSALLAEAHDWALAQPILGLGNQEDDECQLLPLQCFHQNGQEEPLHFSRSRAKLEFILEYVKVIAPGLLVETKIQLEEGPPQTIETLQLMVCSKPGILSHNNYYRFEDVIKRKHLKHLLEMKDLIIPQPLFGSFVENALPDLMRYGSVRNQEVIESFVTMPFVSELKAECDISYIDNELEASIYFLYDKIRIPGTSMQVSYEQIMEFVGEQGILARNLTEEQAILDDLFQGFVHQPNQSSYIARSEKKIIEFMTEVIPRYQNRISFRCPANLLEKFVYDQTVFSITLKESERVDCYEVSLKVDGHLNGISLDRLWECLSARRCYIELDKKSAGIRNRHQEGPKILVLDLEKISPIVQLFDEIGIQQLSNHRELRPLWSLVNLNATQWEELPVKFTMSKKLRQIQELILGNLPIENSDVPQEIQATLRPYQLEGIHWLERLRKMHLNGILADDMGLGKTLQAIIAITQQKLVDPSCLTLVVAPTSLLYNWKEEFNKFNPQLNVLVVDGVPLNRRRLIAEITHYDVVITSYSLLQKDTEYYKEIPFTYAILDEAQHIKNRGTRNAKSVKMIQAAHRLILTGTPIENSLDELWSLFDFLMPGLLSSYDRFVEKYVRGPKQGEKGVLDALRKKVAPFILRRMKRDVLKDLPPITDIVYYCHLSEVQRELYNSYAASAREELAQLVKKEGFERVQIHVLATLTRLKQICCHPAIFAKEEVENGDSAKYDMLLELLQTLIEGGHKTVIFSQYTRMLGIMRDDFHKRGITFEYLDGSSKNRLEIVKRFNETQTSVFLVSLRAGGVGLNLKSADTVIHFDMWWNPAVEDQATARAHRIGQEQNVTAIKLVTLNTIEEKILTLQQRKQGLSQQVINCDEELVSKLLTWQEVLELLQT